jgi:hypothetical protein
VHPQMLRRRNLCPNIAFNAVQISHGGPGV